MTEPKTPPTGPSGVSDATPLYRFKGRATGSDPTGYYYENWSPSKVQPLSVLATNKAEAAKKAWALLGSHPRHGRGTDGSGWSVIWDSIDEEARGD